jgi:hypothetical protein
MATRSFFVGAAFFVVLIGLLCGRLAIDNPLLFAVGMLLVVCGFGVFYRVGMLDGRAVATPREQRPKRARVAYVFFLTCIDFVIAGLAAAVLTPPDPWSMLLLCAPLLAAFSVSYLVGRRHGRRVGDGPGRKGRDAGVS